MALAGGLCLVTPPGAVGGPTGSRDTFPTRDLVWPGCWTMRSGGSGLAAGSPAPGGTWSTRTRPTSTLPSPSSAGTVVSSPLETPWPRPPSARRRRAGLRGPVPARRDRLARADRRRPARHAHRPPTSVTRAGLAPRGVHRWSASPGWCCRRASSRSLSTTSCGSRENSSVRDDSLSPEDRTREAQWSAPCPRTNGP